MFVFLDLPRGMLLTLVMHLKVHFFFQLTATEVYYNNVNVRHFLIFPPLPKINWPARNPFQECIGKRAARRIVCEKGQVKNRCSTDSFSVAQRVHNGFTCFPNLHIWSFVSSLFQTVSHKDSSHIGIGKEWQIANGNGGQVLVVLIESHIVRKLTLVACK